MTAKQFNRIVTLVGGLQTLFTDDLDVLVTGDWPWRPVARPLTGAARLDGAASR